MKWQTSRNRSSKVLFATCCVILMGDASLCAQESPQKGADKALPVSNNPQGSMEDAAKRTTSSKTRKTLQVADRYAELQQALKRFEDPAFKIYVDIAQVGKAWDALDSALLTDIALKLAYAEDVLERPHRRLTADMALDLALKLAIETGDQASIARLSQAADRYEKTELAESIATSQDLSLASRSLGVPVGAVISVSPSALQLYRTYSAELVRCRVTSDAKTLDQIAASTAYQRLPNDLRVDIQRQIEQLKQELQPPGDVAKATGDAESTEGQPSLSSDNLSLKEILRGLSQISRATESLNKNK